MYRCPRHTKFAFNLIDSGHLCYGQFTVKKGKSPEQCQANVSWAQMCNSVRWHAFLKVIRWPVLGLNWTQAQIQDFSQSKKLCLLVSIASPASFWFSEHDLLHTNVENYFQCSFIAFIVFNLRIALKRPYNKQLINLLCSVITGKSQTSALMH